MGQKKLTKWNFVFVISPLKNDQAQKFLSLPHIIIRVLSGVGTRIFEFRWVFIGEIKNKILLGQFLFCPTLYWGLANQSKMLETVLKHGWIWKCPYRTHQNSFKVDIVCFFTFLALKICLLVKYDTSKEKNRTNT